MLVNLVKDGRMAGCMQSLNCRANERTKVGKPIADIYVDDRGLQFQGNWDETLTQILSFKTWQEKEDGE